MMEQVSMTDNANTANGAQDFDYDFVSRQPVEDGSSRRSRRLPASKESRKTTVTSSNSPKKTPIVTRTSSSHPNLSTLTSTPKKEDRSPDYQKLARNSVLFDVNSILMEVEMSNHNHKKSQRTKQKEEVIEEETTKNCSSREKKSNRPVRRVASTGSLMELRIGEFHEKVVSKEQERKQQHSQHKQHKDLDVIAPDTTRSNGAGETNNKKVKNDKKGMSHSKSVEPSLDHTAGAPAFEETRKHSKMIRVQKPLVGSNFASDLADDGILHQNQGQYKDEKKGMRPIRYVEASLSSKPLESQNGIRSSTGDKRGRTQPTTTYDISNTTPTTNDNESSCRGRDRTRPSSSSRVRSASNGGRLAMKPSSSAGSLLDVKKNSIMSPLGRSSNHGHSGPEKYRRECSPLESGSNHRELSPLRGTSNHGGGRSPLGRSNHEKSKSQRGRNSNFGGGGEKSPMGQRHGRLPNTNDGDDNSMRRIRSMDAMNMDPFTQRTAVMAGSRSSENLKTKRKPRTSEQERLSPRRISKAPTRLPRRYLSEDGGPLLSTTKAVASSISSGNLAFSTDRPYSSRTTTAGHRLANTGRRVKSGSALAHLVTGDSPSFSPLSLSPKNATFNNQQHLRSGRSKRLAGTGTRQRAMIGSCQLRQVLRQDLLEYREKVRKDGAIHNFNNDSSDSATSEGDTDDSAEKIVETQTDGLLFGWSHGNSNSNTEKKKTEEEEEEESEQKVGRKPSRGKSMLMQGFKLSTSNSKELGAHKLKKQVGAHNLSASQQQRPRDCGIVLPMVQNQPGTVVPKRSPTATMSGMHASVMGQERLDVHRFSSTTAARPMRERPQGSRQPIKNNVDKAVEAAEANALTNVVQYFQKAVLDLTAV